MSFFKKMSAVTCSAALAASVCIVAYAADPQESVLSVTGTQTLELGISASQAVQQKAYGNTAIIIGAPGTDAGENTELATSGMTLKDFLEKYGKISVKFNAENMPENTKVGLWIYGRGSRKAGGYHELCAPTIDVKNGNNTVEFNFEGQNVTSKKVGTDEIQTNWTGNTTLEDVNFVLYFSDYKEGFAIDKFGEAYTVSAEKELTTEEFSAVLKENQTKDVVIDAGDVSFTFKKGEMKAVDGAKYDFGASVNTDISKLGDANKSITKGNFIMSVDFNYSGDLPAAAEIKINVGKDYAGKTLYYSQITEKGCIFIQKAVVDSEGFLTVSQDHCSTYVITSEDVGGVPGTGVALAVVPLALAAAGAVVLRKRR